MAPGQLVKIVRPAVAYEEMAEGAKEKEGKAQELEFSIQEHQRRQCSFILHP